MLVKTYGSAVYGVDALTITIEVNISGGHPKYFMVGLPDNAVKESLQRVESALQAVGNDGGLSKDILKFYRKEFDLSIEKFKTGDNYDALKNRMLTYNPSNTSTASKYSKSANYRNMDNKIFFLDLYSVINTP